jgi:hypothetical protein
MPERDQITRLEFTGSGREANYLLNGVPVVNGERLEVLTPLGWLAGEFQWSHNLLSWGRLAVQVGDDPDDLLLIVLAPGTRCRRVATLPLRGRHARKAIN